jgi:hypothetical protein
VTATPPDPRRTIRKLNLIGLVIAVLLIGGVGGWATTTQLAGAVIASGSIVVESNVKKVQHPTGGVVGEIRTCQASAVAPDDQHRRRRAMPNGKIVPRSSWSAGTASRRPRSRRAYGHGSTYRAALRRKPPSRRLCLTSTPAQRSSGPESDEPWAARRIGDADTLSGCRLRPRRAQPSGNVGARSWNGGTPHRHMTGRQRSAPH